MKWRRERIPRRRDNLQPPFLGSTPLASQVRCSPFAERHLPAPAHPHPRLRRRPAAAAYLIAALLFSYSLTKSPDPPLRHNTAPVTGFVTKTRYPASRPDPLGVHGCE